MPSTSFGQDMPRPLTIYRLPSSSGGTNATVVATGPKMLLTVDCYNTGPGGIRLALFDQTTVPTSGDTPKMTVFLSGQGKGGDTWPLPGVAFRNGLAFSMMPESENEVSSGEGVELNIGYTEP